MILGLSLATFTLVHVVISLLGIASGILVVAAFLGGRHTAWNALFLGSTWPTSLTGFLFPSKFGPAHVIGILSLGVLAVATYALGSRRLAGRWNSIYIGTAIAALYLNVFVAVVQAFQKVGFLHAIAPTQSDPAFAATQGGVLLVFVAAGVLAIRVGHRSRAAAAGNA